MSLNFAYKSPDYEDRTVWTDVQTSAGDHNGIQAGIRMWDAVMQFYDDGAGGPVLLPWIRTQAQYLNQVGAEIVKGVYDMKFQYLCDVTFPEAQQPVAPYYICPWFNIGGPSYDWRSGPDILGSPMTTVLAPAGGFTTSPYTFGFVKEINNIDLTQNWQGSSLVTAGVTIWTHAVGFAPTLQLRQGWNSMEFRRHPDTTKEAGQTSVSEIKRGSHRFGRARRA